MNRSRLSVLYTRLVLELARKQSIGHRTRGYALFIAVSATLVLFTLLSAYFALTKLETFASLSSVSSSIGFDAAEAGLNLRAETVRQIFEGFNIPAGAELDEDRIFCANGEGVGDFQCQVFPINNYNVSTFLTRVDGAPTDDPELITIPRGEPFGDLNAQEYTYSALSTAARVGEDDPQAVLQMVFRSRLVPLFQFAAFYDKDLEILPGPQFILRGRVHTNGDLYLSGPIDIQSFAPNDPLGNDANVTVAGSLYAGRKDRNDCRNNPRVSAQNGNNSTTVGCNGRAAISTNANGTVQNANGLIDVEFEALELPDVGIFDPDPSAGEDAEYWARADLRLVLNISSSIPEASRLQTFDGDLVTVPGTDAGTSVAVEIRNADGSVDLPRTNLLNSAACRGNFSGFTTDSGNPILTPPVYLSGANRGGPDVRDGGDDFTPTGRFYNVREDSSITLADVNVQGLFDCIDSQNLLDDGKDLDDDTDGGLVFHTTVADGSDLLAGKVEGQATNFGVRFYDGQTLASTNAGAPEIQGLTIASDQAIYVAGNYNSNNKIPASFLADSLNVLSNSWDVWRDDIAEDEPYPNNGPPASSTVINAAFLAGTDTTGGIEGLPQNCGNACYNGGLENYPRFHENWSGDTLTYRGSFVSLGESRFTNPDGSWDAQNAAYNPPVRNWDFDEDFNNAENLPPLSPRFVLLRQELFVRNF